MKSTTLFVLLLLFQATTSLVIPSKSKASRIVVYHMMSNSEEESYIVAEIDTLDANLTPPPVNLRKQSILFDDNATTQGNNNILKTWKSLKRTLPFLVTGARTAEMGDEKPLAAIYNMIFVRLPAIVAAILYGKNLMLGHPLIVDFGDGPFALSPLVVFGIFYVLLR